jgi:hypothetical protein
VANEESGRPPETDAAADPGRAVMERAVTAALASYVAAPDDAAAARAVAAEVGWAPDRAERLIAARRVQLTQQAGAGRAVLRAEAAAAGVVPRQPAVPYPRPSRATLDTHRGESSIPMSSGSAPQSRSEREPGSGLERFPVHGSTPPPPPPPPRVPAPPDPWWLSGRAGLAALLSGVLLGAAHGVGRLTGADPQALIGLALVAFVGS